MLLWQHLGTFEQDTPVFLFLLSFQGCTEMGRVLQVVLVTAIASHEFSVGVVTCLNDDDVTFTDITLSAPVAIQ